MSLTARVFISCGQTPNELVIAEKISNKLIEMGYDPYIALKVHSLKGVKENIFRQLENSEYLIFIDFKRERLFKQDNGDFIDTELYRGSLFSHQELAVASFLEDIEVLAFREKGVKQDDGILGYIQANCIPFIDRSSLHNVVADNVLEKEWDPKKRNELRIEKDIHEHITLKADGRIIASLCLKVKNLHNKKMARRCVAYVENLYDIINKQDFEAEPSEILWVRGGKEVVIGGNSTRSLEALYIFKNDPKTVYLNGLHRNAQITLMESGSWELVYVVFSDNFPPVRARATLTIKDDEPHVQFDIIEN